MMRPLEFYKFLHSQKNPPWETFFSEKFPDLGIYTAIFAGPVEPHRAKVRSSPGRDDRLDEDGIFLRSEQAENLCPRNSPFSGRPGRANRSIVTVSLHWLATGFANCSFQCLDGLFLRRF